MSPFPALPDSARLWLLALDRALEPAQEEALRRGMDAILGEWRHKGHEYDAAWDLLEGRLLTVAEPTLASAPSGCAIDGMLRKVNRIAGELGLRLVDAAAEVVVRLPEGLRAFPKAELGERLADGTLKPDTPVVDLALFSLGDLRAGRLEKPLAATWIGRKYRVQVPA